MQGNTQQSGTQTRRPSPGQPGTLGQQLEAIAAFHRLPDDVRRDDREAVWRRIHDAVLRDGKGVAR